MNNRFIVQNYETYNELKLAIDKNKGIKIFGKIEESNNRYTLIVSQDNELCFGITYYFLGLNPQIEFMLQSNIVFLGFNENIVTIDYVNKQIISEFKLFSLFYEFISISSLNIIISICELDVCVFNGVGEILWKIGFKDIIEDFKIIESDKLYIKCMDGYEIIFSVQDGTVGSLIK